MEYVCTSKFLEEIEKNLKYLKLSEKKDLLNFLYLTQNKCDINELLKKYNVLNINNCLSISLNGNLYINLIIHENQILISRFFKIN